MLLYYRHMNALKHVTMFDFKLSFGAVPTHGSFPDNQYSHLGCIISIQPFIQQTTFSPNTYIHTDTSFSVYLSIYLYMYACIHALKCCVNQISFCMKPRVHLTEWLCSVHIHCLIHGYKSHLFSAGKQSHTMNGCCVWCIFYCRRIRME